MSVALSEGVDLSHHISLRNISFNDKFPPADRWSCRIWIIPVLSSIAHPSLETVTMIYISLYHVEEIDLLELSALHRLFLNQPLSNNSTKLRFDICCRFVDREAVLAAFRDKLPKLDEKKRLEFVLE